MFTVFRFPSNIVSSWSAKRKVSGSAVRISPEKFGFPPATDRSLPARLWGAIANPEALLQLCPSSDHNPGLDLAESPINTTRTYEDGFPVRESRATLHLL
jgi:hypothetical protein